MKRRKRHRAKPMKSVRHGERRARKTAWVTECAANPLNVMTGRQVIQFHRIEKNILKGKKRLLTHDEQRRAVELARIAA